MTQTNPTQAAVTSDLELLARQVTALTGPADRHDEAERAADCAAQAEALRETIPDVEAAQQELAGIEAEAARTVNTARSKLAGIRQHAHAIETEAAAIELKGRSYRAAANLAQQAQAARQEAEKLAAERQERLADAEALTARISELDGLQRAAQADLETAKAATDVDGAGEAQQRLLGITAVMPPLTQQRDAATARARAIGVEGSGGEFAQALGRAAALLVQRGQALDNAEPERVEARRAANPVAALLEDISKMPAAAQKEIISNWSATATKDTKGPGRATRAADGSITITPGR